MALLQGPSSISASAPFTWFGRVRIGQSGLTFGLGLGPLDAFAVCSGTTSVTFVPEGLITWTLGDDDLSKDTGRATP